MYESPDVDKLNGASPAGINDYVWMNTVAIGEAYVAVVIDGVFFQTIFQVDTTYPVSIPNDPVES